MLLHMDERFPTRRHIADCPLLQSFDIIVLAIRSAPLIDIAFGDSSLRSSGDISLRSAGMS